MSHYFSEKQGSRLILRKVAVVIRGNTIPLYLASGVFSSRRVDKGSQLLADTAIVEDGWRVLDLGCGSGVVGIGIARAFPNIVVVMADINERAVETARRNAKLNRVDCEVIKSDAFKRINGRFDTILINPPQTAGKEVCLRLIGESKEHLKPGGTLQLVARHNKGGKSLNNYMQEVYKNSRVISKSGGYRVYLSENA